jgi:hypothetical protein
VNCLPTIPIPSLISRACGSRVLDTIRDDEVVTARAVPSRSGRRINDSAENVPQTHSPIRSYNERNVPASIQIRLITAELARAHARVSLKDDSAVMEGFLAFDGEFISGNTSLVMLRCIR